MLLFAVCEITVDHIEAGCFNLDVDLLVATKTSLINVHMLCISELECVAVARLRIVAHKADIVASKER